jgi:radical SAM superfamily enzyme YgiQ (UPF0313 family)
VIGLHPYPRYHGNVVRPPSEADSLILQVMYGCSYGKCAFCGSYLGKAFRLRSMDAIKEDIENVEEELKQNVTRVFLCDGDVLALPTLRMVDILETLKRQLPSLTRISGYANAHSLQRFAVDELKELRESGLELLYVGLESGDDATLIHSGKGLSSNQLVQAFLRAKAAGMALSVTAILGLGGVDRSEAHAQATGRALTRIDPEHIGILSLMVEPGTRLAEAVRRDQFTVPDARGLLSELRTMIAETDVSHAMLRTDDEWDHLALAGALPGDKETLLSRLDEAIAAADKPPVPADGQRAR